MSVLMIYRILRKGFGDAGASKLQFFVKNKMALSSILQIERVREKRLGKNKRLFVSSCVLLALSGTACLCPVLYR